MWKVRDLLTVTVVCTTDSPSLTQERPISAAPRCENNVTAANRMTTADTIAIPPRRLRNLDVHFGGRALAASKFLHIDRSPTAGRNSEPATTAPHDRQRSRHSDAVGCHLISSKDPIRNTTRSLQIFNSHF